MGFLGFFSHPEIPAGGIPEGKMGGGGGDAQLPIFQQGNPSPIPKIPLGAAGRGRDAAFLGGNWLKSQILGRFGEESTKKGEEFPKK